MHDWTKERKKGGDDAEIADCSAHTDGIGQSGQQTAVAPGWGQPLQPARIANGAEIIIFIDGKVSSASIEKIAQSGKEVVRKWEGFRA